MNLTKIISKFILQENDVFENSIKNNANLKIKGKITKEKLKQNGIKMVIDDNRKWIEQNGIKISPIIVYDFKLKNIEI